MNANETQVVVLGAGESGVGAALLYQHVGYKVFVSDYGTIAPKYKAELEAAGIPYEEGKHSTELILSATEVVKSPGIPHKAPIVKALLERGIPIISEIELAGRYTQSKMLGITGSNGKTTTTMWLHHILKTAGYSVGLAGNVGFSLARQVMASEQPDYYVLELSSFQLDDMYQFHVDVALVMNITPDHLDRYNYNIEEYALAKMRILQNQTADDAFVYWGEDEFLSKYVLAHQPMPMKLLPFHTYPQVGAAADRSDEGYMRLRVGETCYEFPVAELALQGPHNLQNAMAASLAALSVGVSPSVLDKALRDFVNVPHRLEKVALINDVRYINDSKATNISSTYYALRTMTTPYVLILGGTDKGNNYEDIADLVVSGARALVLLTTDTAKLHATFDGRIAEIVEARSMAEAIAQCHRLAQPGDTVLLSPACASFDLFRNYEHRGDSFREEVLALKQRIEQD
ncbi:MAG: UDP-N-acetylmuramoyl-L-alanine--D-glutamate ligase [Porphyromonas sp.]|nr:UDP-N-acetylmuramoyl-L-alanine--D-glutamate ligase [Porphyromonas sp.]